MQDTIITIFCYVDDFLKALSWKDDSQCRLCLAEIVTIALTAARFFAGNLEAARIFLAEHGYLPLIGKSRLNRRIHAIPAFFWHFIVSYLSAKQNPDCKCFLVDSFPIAVCHSIRASRRSLFRGKKYIGYNACKKMWFTGLKVHIIATFQGQPKEFAISAASMHDLTALQKMYFGTLPRGSTMFGDKAYTSRAFEQKLLAYRDIFLVAERKVNSSRGQSLIYSRYGKRIRKKIETAFSTMVNWLPRRIHAVTDRGFLLKLMILITAFSLSFLNF
jgi:Transposase DDE domain.